MIWDALRSLWRSLLRSRDEREIDEEIRFHLEMKARALEARGLPTEEARLAARRAFGSPLATREATHESWCATWLEIFLLDSRVAARSLGRRPLLAFVLITTLALGIGANTAVFGLLRPLLLESPPVRDPESLYVLGTRIGGGAMLSSARDTSFLSYAFFEALRSRVETGELEITGLAAFGSFSNRVYARSDDGEAPPVSLDGRLVSDNFFDVLGLTPSAGRFFEPADDAPDAAPVVVIAHALWERRLASSPDAVSRPLVLNGRAYDVVGIAPEGFRGIEVGEDTDVWVPLRHQAAVMGESDSWLTEANLLWLRSIGRLASGARPEAVRSSLETVFLGLIRDETGEAFTEEQTELLSEHPVALVPVRDAFSMLRLEFEEPLRLLMAVVVIVLLVVCANVGNLLLLRNASRQRELAARLALGASHARLVRQILTECLLLALIGGGLGLVASAFVRDLLLRFLIEGRPHVYLDTGTDAPLLGFALLVSLGAVLVFGLAPVLRLSNLKPSTFARAASTTGTTTDGSRRRLEMTHALIVAEVAASLVLLVAAGLLLSSLDNISRVDSGLAYEQILVVRLDPVGSGLTPSELAPAYAELRERVEAIPGVRSASLSMFPRFTGASWIAPIELPGDEHSTGDNRASIEVVDGDFFRTLGIPVLRGRGFTELDDESTGAVAVVNETFVRAFYPNEGGNGLETALGRRFLWDENLAGDASVSIVGIVPDVKAHDLREQPMPVVYFPARQSMQHMESLEVRTGGDPATFARQVRDAIRAVAPGLPVAEALPMAAQMDRALRNEVLVSRLTAAFAALCALMTAIGLYGLLGYAVSLRTKEIGLRMALGATSRGMARMFLSKGLRLFSIGALAGLVASFAVARTMERFLFGLSGMEPVIVVLALLGLTAVALVAIGIPARRASRCDPMSALRWE